MNLLRIDFWMEPLLEEELSQEEMQRILRDLVTIESWELGALLLRSRPSREIRNLQPIPSFFYSFWILAVWPFCHESLEQNCWWYLRERYEYQRLLRDVLSLVDQGVSGVLLGETQAELVRVSRAIFLLQRRLTYLSFCLLTVRIDPLFVLELLDPELVSCARL